MLTHSPPTELYLEHQGKIMDGYLAGKNIVLSGPSNIKLGEFYARKNTIGGEKPTENTLLSLNLCQQRLLKDNSHLGKLFEIVDGGSIMLQDVLYDETLFEYFSQDLDYNVIVIPISHTDPQWCMVILTRENVEKVHIQPLFQHKGKVAAFHSAYSDRLPLARNHSRDTAATYLMISISDTTQRILGNTYLPCTLGSHEREQNIRWLSEGVKNGGIIVGDWNIYGSRIGEYIDVPPSLKKILRKIPDSIAGKLGIHTNGNIARYPLGIGLNLLTGSDRTERNMLVGVAKELGAKLSFPDTPTIRKGPIGMTLDGALTDIATTLTMFTVNSPGISDHMPIIFKK